MSGPPEELPREIDGPAAPEKSDQTQTLRASAPEPEVIPWFVVPTDALDDLPAPKNAASGLPSNGVAMPPGWIPDDPAPEPARETGPFTTSAPAEELAPLPVFNASEFRAAMERREEDEQPLFEAYSKPEILAGPRIPHFGHLLMLVLLLVLGLISDWLATLAAIQFHLLGITNLDQVNTDIHYTLGGEVVLDLVAFIGCLIVFPLMWRKGFFAGISWRGAQALRLSPWLVGAAFGCFLLALFNGWLMPGPADTPIDRVFRVPGAAWLLFGFGVTFAPFFEEIVFRGFILPALCTACDWIAETSFDKTPRPLDSDGQPRWSMPAMIVGTVLTSIPFAGMHAAQTGYSLGPFVLLVAVSLVLCAARLVTRSLAASVLLHAAYNLMLFSLMLFGTGGFKHLENM